MSGSFQIAVVEDDNILRHELVQFISRNGFSVFEASSSAGLDDLLSIKKFDLIVLDINLPGRNGLEIAQKIRHTNPYIGIVMLTARTSSEDRIKGYEMGADIYLPKPTKPAELLAAIVTLKRRILNTNASGWRLDATKRILLTDLGIEIKLTATESQLLLAFNNANDRILETGVIYDIMHEKNHGNEVTKRAVENILSRLRTKITEASPEIMDKKVIQSVWKQGYQLCITMIVI